MVALNHQLGCWFYLLTDNETLAWLYLSACNIFNYISLRNQETKIANFSSFNIIIFFCFALPRARSIVFNSIIIELAHFWRTILLNCLLKYVFFLFLANYCETRSFVQFAFIESKRSVRSAATDLSQLLKSKRLVVLKFEKSRFNWRFLCRNKMLYKKKSSKFI